MSVNMRNDANDARFRVGKGPLGVSFGISGNENSGPRDPDARGSTLRPNNPQPDPLLTRLSDDENYRELHKLDRALYKLSKHLAAEYGDGCESAELITDARERLWKAAHQIALDSTPKVTTYIRNAVQRASARRSAS
jgi:hypothetical protein